MVDTLQAIADIEEKPEFKARYFFTMAQVYPRQDRGHGPGGRAVQRGAGSQPELPGGVRAHQQDPDPGEELEAARAFLPEDAPPHRRQGEQRPRAHAVAPARSGLSRPPRSDGRGDRGVQDGRDRQAGRATGTPDPGGAVRKHRALRRGDHRTALDPRARLAARRSVPGPVSSVSAEARLRRGVAGWRRPWRS